MSKVCILVFCYFIMGFFDDVMGGLKDTLREDLSTFMESVIISPYKWGRKL